MKKEPAKQPDRLYHASIGVLVIVVLVSGGLLVSRFVQNRQELSAFAQLAEQKAAVDLLMMNKAELPSGMEAASFIENTPEPEPEISEDALSESQPPLSVAVDPYDQNKDMIGWIRIEDSAVDYPVMFTGDDFYINHGFDKKGSKSGVPYVDGQCTVNPLGTNTLIHGHNMKNGTMFSGLLAYIDQNYYEAHPLIQFELDRKKHSYEIIAVIQSRVYAEDESGFLHYRFLDAQNSTDFDAYLSEIKRLSLYDTGVTAVYGDQFITLSTCSYHTENGRFLVIARKTDE